MHLYGSTIPSGNVYKVQLLLSHLNISYEQTLLDIQASPPESRRPEFLSINPNGRIPALVLDDGTALSESNAILFYLAENTPYFPDDKIQRARVMQWLFFEQYSHEPYVAVWKYRTYWKAGGFSDLTNREITNLKENGQAAIDIMEKHLQGREWFAGEAYSIADIALYAYTSSAERIGFSVGANVRAWLDRVESTEGWVRIPKDESGRNPF